MSWPPPTPRNLDEDEHYDSGTAFPAISLLLLAYTNRFPVAGAGNSPVAFFARARHPGGGPADSGPSCASS